MKARQHGPLHLREGAATEAQPRATKRQHRSARSTPLSRGRLAWRRLQCLKFGCRGDPGCDCEKAVPVRLPNAPSGGVIRTHHALGKCQPDLCRPVNGNNKGNCPPFVLNAHSRRRHHTAVARTNSSRVNNLNDSPRIFMGIVRRTLINTAGA